MNSPIQIADRLKRSLRLRTRSARRLLQSSCKSFYQSSELVNKSISQAGIACDSQTDLLRTNDDAVWRACSATTVMVKNVKSVIASEGTRNKTTLEASLSEARFQTPEIVFGRFHNCVADPISIRLVTKKAELISETTTVHDLLDPRYRDGGHLIRGGGAVRQLRKSHNYVDEDVLFAFNSFSPSYGHYLLTSLPIVFYFFDEIKKGSLKIVVSANQPPWVTQHLSELGLSEQDYLYLPDSSYQFRSAIVSNIIDASNTRAPNPNSLWWAQQLAQDAMPLGNTPTRRIYVRRSQSGDVSSRTISNEEELIRRLASAGYRIIEPARMHFRDQIKALYDADVIVSPHGSTLANIVFCRPGARVFDLMPDSWVGIRGDSLRDVWASRMCEVAKLEYSVFLCPSYVRQVHFTGNAAMTSRICLTDLMNALANSAQSNQRPAKG